MPRAHHAPQRPRFSTWRCLNSSSTNCANFTQLLATVWAARNRKWRNVGTMATDRQTDAPSLNSYLDEFLHEKNSKLKSITHVQMASRFLHWNTRDIARSRFAGETPARSVGCIPTEKKTRRDLNESDALFLPFSGGENYLSIGSMVQRYKIDSEKRPWSVGSVARSVVNRVGRLGCSS